MNRPDEDALDRLLARAPLPGPDAWFAARTLARCRHEGLSGVPDTFFLARFWRWAVGGSLGACLALFCVAQLQPVAPASAANEQDVQDAFAIVASADSDSDTSTSTATTWQDTSL